LEFLHGDVNKYECREHVHLVISLHACDIATDFVLNKATEWQADVILSTPCCHHEMNHTVSCEALSFVTKHSMLRQKLCDAATDALRLARLEACGYTVCALELIDPEETPKNIMLRALRRHNFDPASPEAERLRASFEAARNDGYRRFIMFLHYPPTNILEKRSAFTDIAEEYGADYVIYAHCHGRTRFHDSLEGIVRGVEYRLVSGDYLLWKPERIL
jgi:hypothetical protein